MTGEKVLRPHTFRLGIGHAVKEEDVAEVHLIEEMAVKEISHSAVCVLGQAAPLVHGEETGLGKGELAAFYTRFQRVKDGERGGACGDAEGGIGLFLQDLSQTIRYIGAQSGIVGKTLHHTYLQLSTGFAAVET